MKKEYASLKSLINPQATGYYSAEAVSCKETNTYYKLYEQKAMACFIPFDLKQKIVDALRNTDDNIPQCYGQDEKQEAVITGPTIHYSAEPISPLDSVITIEHVTKMCAARKIAHEMSKRTDGSFLRNFGFAKFLHCAGVPGDIVAWIIRMNDDLHWSFDRIAKEIEDKIINVG